jgi:hypothetical protein
VLLGALYRAGPASQGGGGEEVVAAGGVLSLESALRGRGNRLVVPL